MAWDWYGKCVLVVEGRGPCVVALQGNWWAGPVGVILEQRPGAGGGLWLDTLATNTETPNFHIFVQAENSFGRGCLLHCFEF